MAVSAFTRASRVNITLELETHGVKQQQELPMKCLVLGNFSGQAAHRPLAQSERIRVDARHLDAVIAQVQPQCHLQINNHLGGDEPLSVHLQPRRLSDFSPEGIVEQVPELSRLLAMRRLLRELKANLIDDVRLKRRLQTVLGDPQQREQLRQALQQYTPLHTQAGSKV